jgi:polyphenol oxidase
MPLPAGWLVPQWPAPPQVRAVCTTRSGGVSQGAYESLNLGDHVGDAPGRVAENRARFAAAIDARPVFLQQVHGRQVMTLDANTRDGAQADGCLTRERGVACTIMVADCLPVLFTDDQGSIVAAAHAGWRGLAAGVLEAAVQRSGIRPQALLAWLGPCIGPDAFEVGGEVKAAFEAQDRAAATLFKVHAGNKWLADLPGLARQRLQALGATRIYGNDGTREWCTVGNRSRLFSHRRDGVSGRFAAAVWLA